MSSLLPKYHILKASDNSRTILESAEAQKAIGEYISMIEMPKKAMASFDKLSASHMVANTKPNTVLFAFPRAAESRRVHVYKDWIVDLPVGWHSENYAVIDFSKVHFANVLEVPLNYKWRHFVFALTDEGVREALVVEE